MKYPTKGHNMTLFSHLFLCTSSHIPSTVAPLISQRSSEAASSLSILTDFDWLESSAWNSFCLFGSFPNYKKG